MASGLGTLFVILPLLLLANAASGANLCNQNCLLSISFPNGGSIEAVEALSITFGDGGLVDTAGSVTAYVAGETLTLNAGDSLDFGSGGSFDIGNAGNIDYTNMAITTKGEVRLTAVGGDERLQIHAEGRLAFADAALISVESAFYNEGTLVIGDGSILNLSGPAQPDGCDLSSPGGATLSVSAAAPLVLDNNSGCNVLNTILTTTPAVTAGSLSLTDPATNVVLGNFSPSIAQPPFAGGLTLADTDDDRNTGDSSASGGSGATSVGLYWLLFLAALAAAKRIRRQI